MRVPGESEGWISPAANGVTLNVRVVPRAARTEVSGVVAGALKVRLQAVPVDGKANRALIRFLARTLGLPPRAVVLVSGETGRHKRVRVDGITLPQVVNGLGLGGVEQPSSKRPSRVRAPAR